MELMEVFTAEGALFFALVRVRETSAVKTSDKLGGFKEESPSASDINQVIVKAANFRIVSTNLPWRRPS